tara:strand:- start:318 stop:1100 length:783 start_codon:yes stop_codon:yes gene_type:complete
MNILKKIKHYYLNVGLLKTILKILSKPLVVLRNIYLEKKIFKKKKPSEIFTQIFKTNYWNDTDSKSGTGSSLKSTENIRKELPLLLKEFKINSVLDIPCGDFFWIKKIINDLDIIYMGGDIVEDIIDNNKKFENNKIKFKKIDLLNESLPETDLILCRDCIFHFSYEDIDKTFDNFKKTNFRYLLITNHDLENKNIDNKNIQTGSFRFLDFHKKPYNFQKNYSKEIFDLDFPPSYVNKKMLLFSKKEFISNVENYQKNLK